MQPAYIIEELRRREEARRNLDRRARLELPEPPPPARREIEPRAERGVVIIELMR